MWKMSFIWYYWLYLCTDWLSKSLRMKINQNYCNKISKSTIFIYLFVDDCCVIKHRFVESHYREKNVSNLILNPMKTLQVFELGVIISILGYTIWIIWLWSIITIDFMKVLWMRWPIYNKWMNMWVLCDFITYRKIIHSITYTMCAKCLDVMKSEWNCSEITK